MNKYLFILGLVGTALLSACSADDLTTVLSPEEERAIVAEAGKDSDVPIMLGMVGNSQIAMTRTPIDSDAGTNLFETPAGKYLGVYCLAKGKQVESQMINTILPATSAEIDWSISKYAKWLDNVPAKVVKYNFYESPNYYYQRYSEVQFMKNIDSSPEQINYYYPFGNWYYYNFYAYYPRSGSVTISKDDVYADISITGREDIIHGMASSDDATYASENALPYSAKYFRLKKGNNLTVPFNTLPEFVFDHKLAKLEVYVKGNSNFEVTSATISGVYKNLTLCVASKTTSGVNPTGYLTIKEGSTPGDLSLSKVDTGVDVDPFAGGTTIPVTAAETYIGYVMIPPTDLLGESEKYIVILGMKQTSSGDPLPNKIVELKNLDESRMVFEKGKSYKITLNIN